MKKGVIPDDLQGKELFSFLKANKALIIAHKKYNVKETDSFRLTNLYVNNKGEITKSNSPVAEDLSVIKVSSVINTTNWMDSHSDVHMPGIWKKSLSENKGLYLLQEHSMTFKGIITDQVDGFTKSMSWRDLGVDIPGMTEALIFNSIIDQSRNTFMFNEYKMGRVKNHSVGMRYVIIEMAIDDEDYKEEYATWQKYIDQVANKSEAEDKGYFFAVKEAKVIEGSAVPVGSNIITPTLDNNMPKSTSTDEQPPLSTVEQPQKFDIARAIRVTKFIN